MFIKSKDIAIKALSLTIKNGGATIDPKNGACVETGFAVGGIREFKFYSARLDQFEEIVEAVKEIRIVHSKMKVGFWMDGSTLYVDAIAVVNDEDTARNIAELHGEIAYFNLDTNQEVRV